MKRILENAQEIGLVKKDIPINLTMEILSVCLKAMVQSGNRLSAEDALDLFLDIFCDGIADSKIRSTGENSE